EGARVLDLFAGAGALGLEALSRGAASCDFVESGAVSLHALKANVAARKLRPPDPKAPPSARRKTARVFKRDAIPFVRGLEAGSYDLAFADPPYGSRKLDLVVEQWMSVRFARVLAVEHAPDHRVPEGGRRHEIDDCVVTIYGLPPRGPRRGRSARSGKAGRGAAGADAGSERPRGARGGSGSRGRPSKPRASGM
ncbi:MAG TPA: RsmD family RNA methyltransferase, partial [Longimicrobiales bacterium]|nr:RsmD family RNA methyltransferase [Longimicrobiales bacterium]